ncbi:hypothetical protein HYPSUDRAFT_208443 [Hypholoma sublateritium FD-334 SS-4]|uniref:Uncharacterized protein n=1 Tax=Hypholoma sublateritium (strain FD-334 SS-4) TaxID=945553 RepID=A0A0D2LVB5_HYPSF|nr:hypothetical protein HYPSUDRAFT_208443 [Hypholoma sublateritium FD-334 SS-4]
MEFTKPMDISPFRTEIHPPHSTASFRSKDEKSSCSRATEQSCYKPYNPWIAFLQAANAAPPPYTQHAERPSYDLLSASGRVQHQSMIGLQMEQAAEQLRKVGIYQAEHGRQARDQIDDTFKRANKARQATHECAWRAPQDAGRRSDCAASSFSTSQFSVEESTDPYTYTKSRASGDITAIISPHSHPGDGASY